MPAAFSSLPHIYVRLSFHVAGHSDHQTQILIQNSIRYLHLTWIHEAKIGWKLNKCDMCTDMEAKRLQDSNFRAWEQSSVPY